MLTDAAVCSQGGGEKPSRSEISVEGSFRLWALGLATLLYEAPPDSSSCEQVSLQQDRRGGVRGGGGGGGRIKSSSTLLYSTPSLPGHTPSYCTLGSKTKIKKSPQFRLYFRAFLHRLSSMFMRDSD